MDLQRRQFLALAGIGSAGVLFGGKLLLDRASVPPSTTEGIPENPFEPSASSSSPLLRFLAVADTGTGCRAQYAVAGAMADYHTQNPVDLVVLGGDNIYNFGQIEKISRVFEEPYQPLLDLGVKFYAVLGNHDVMTDNGTPQVLYPGFNMGGRYYTFTRDRVQFFALDTNHETDRHQDAWGEQLDWLETELSRSTALWKIVFAHHQIYSSGPYGIDEGRIRTLTPLFERYGVQLYINGHEHHYERTEPINGTAYLICGAGAKLRSVGRSDWTAHSASTHSFAACEVYDDRLEIRAIDRDRQIFDIGAISLASSVLESGSNL